MEGTLWLFREKLAKAGLIEKLFDRFDQHLAAQGYMARGGQMVDATIVPVPKRLTAVHGRAAIIGLSLPWQQHGDRSGPGGRSIRRRGPAERALSGVAKFPVHC